MLTLQEIIEATQGKLLEGKPIIVTGVSTDSRTVKRGDIFIALSGEKFDGHDYILDVIKKGARAILVSKNVKASVGIAVVQVKDTGKALGHLAAFYRLKFNIPVIALTGSAGKTTTKEMLAHVLSSQYKVLKNIKTENNHIGVPQTLLRLDKNYDMAVLEFGTNQPGDIDWLSFIAKPNVVIFTNIGDSHLEKLKNREGVFKEKFRIVAHMAREGKIVFNADDPYLSRIQKLKLTQQKIGYSIKRKSLYRAEKIALTQDGQIKFQVKNQTLVLNAIARHFVYNALAVIACADLFRIKASNLKKTLKTFMNCSGRQEIKRMKGLTIIDDTYNANPTSLKSAVDSLNEIPAQGRKILVCGDMLELGKDSKKLHADAGIHISRSRIDQVLTYGQHAYEISRLLMRTSKKIEATHYESLEKLEQDLHHICRKNDIVLVKGSRGMRMERVVEALKTHFNN